ncbi:cytochrome c biogenesis protein CcsA [Xanthomonas fragariae]|uniref:cytochrome c biogenesis protein CcsA n=1 Tax=Xanthomonas fragariae TaxID=48664 RepID=UPI001ABDB02C|nr:cytochrome c biogenesis protein CcsA [Xanthomonas fragariae]UKR51225.1 cytochrome c biogenesis protein CcsA [Xanthomonas fragariae]
MTPEFGHIALILALLLSLAQGVLPLIGVWRGNTALIGIARPAAVGQAVFVWMAFGLPAWLLLWLDFSVRSVADNANIALPWYYRFAAVWGAHEGSLLLWIAILATWTLLLAAFSRHLPQHLAARVLTVLELVSVGFLALILRTSNPFGRLSPIPLDGNELNPVLQDPGMTFHPPVLYIGYVGFSVAFAFTVAALLGGELEQAWVRWARPWTNLAWACLTAGIVADSWWAYAELGWGGWGFCHPVENASFMPWLVGTALIHTQAVTESIERIQTESAIDPSVTRDLYVALGEPLDDQHIEYEWTLRLYYKPFIRWIWAGGLLTMMAGVVSAGARRFRAPVTADKAATSSAHDAFVIAQESHP